MENNQFTVIIGDLIDSRKISDRDVFSGTLNSVLKSVTILFKSAFYAIPNLTGIDGLSVVLYEPAMSYKFCRAFNERIYPEQFRFAIVNGKLDVGVESRESGKMDGIAFHKASGLIESMKISRNKNININEKTNKNKYYRFEIKEEGRFNEILDELTNLTHLFRMGLTGRQRDVFYAYSMLRNQTEVANKLGITQQAVSISLRRAHYEDITRAEEFVDILLSEVN